jgi:hypothetical protein
LVTPSSNYGNTNAYGTNSSYGYQDSENSAEQSSFADENDDNQRTIMRGMAGIVDQANPLPTVGNTIHNEAAVVMSDDRRFVAYRD